MLQEAVTTKRTSHAPLQDSVFKTLSYSGQVADETREWKRVFIFALDHISKWPWASVYVFDLNVKTLSWSGQVADEALEWEHVLTFALGHISQWSWALVYVFDLQLFRNYYREALFWMGLRQPTAFHCLKRSGLRAE